MIRLKGAHQGDRAVVVFGGPSLMARGFDFGALRGRGFVTFLDTKALTPHVVRAGFVPDYYLLLFPEKAKAHSLHHVVFQSFLADYRIDPLLTRESRCVAEEMRASFDETFEPWRPHRGLHKKYRWRPGVFLRDSPFDLLDRIPASRIIVNRPLVEHYFPDFQYADRTYYYESPPEPFVADRYFNPTEEDGRVLVRCADTFMNSAAIVLYPLLNYMGFREAYFLGMDMSLLGSNEYSAPYTFRSMAHFWWFHRRNGRVYNSNYRANGWMFARPQSEFNDIRQVWGQSPVRFTRVHEPWKYASRVDGIRTLSFEQFFDEVGR